ncbi:hypothetical protein VH569_22820 [Azospirillum sp. 11R-A]|uniref:hypothetical protein n=1 Tax=Azospirillum sp. 11R-A TaxID=3111634 RepID=UPI003C2647D4
MTTLDEVEVWAIQRARFAQDPGFAGIIDGSLRALVIDSGATPKTALIDQVRGWR